MNHYNVHNKYRLNKTQFSIIYFYCHFVNVFCKLLTAAGNILPPFLPFLKSLREKRDGRKRTKLGTRRIQNMTYLKESAKIKKKMELRNIFSTTIFFWNYFDVKQTNRRTDKLPHRQTTTQTNRQNINWFHSTDAVVLHWCLDEPSSQNQLTHISTLSAPIFFREENWLSIGLPTSS